MNIQPKIPRERPIGDQQPVGRDHNGVDTAAVYTSIYIYIPLQPCRLKNANAQALGNTLRRRGVDLPPPTAGCVRACQNRDDLVSGCKPLEDVCAERGRRRDGDARHD